MQPQKTCAASMTTAWRTGAARGHTVCFYLICMLIPTAVSCSNCISGQPGNTAHLLAEHVSLFLKARGVTMLWQDLGP